MAGLDGVTYALDYWIDYLAHTLNFRGDAPREFVTTVFIHDTDDAHVCYLGILH